MGESDGFERQVMQVTKLFSSIFSVLGTVVLIVSIVLCLMCRNMEPKTRNIPQEARDVSEQFMTFLSAGDYESAGQLIYGQPELGADENLQNSVSARIWEAFRESVTLEAEDSCYLEGKDYCRDVTVSTLDVPGLMQSIASLTQPQQMAVSGEDEALPVSNPDTLLMEAVEEALLSCETVQVQGRLRMVEAGNSWYVIPDKAILTAISGGLG